MDGPLSFGVDNGGGASVDPPLEANGEFSATFGGFVPCSKDGVRATIDSVEVGSEGDRASVYLRRITPEAVKASAREDRGQFIPMAFGLGAPPRFDQPYAGDALSGEFEADVAGQVVKTSCEDVDAAIVAVNNGQVPKTAIEEFLIVVPAGADGAELEGFTVTYSVDEETFRETVSWGMVVCDRAGTRPYCSPLNSE